MKRTNGLFGAGLGLAATLLFAGGLQGQTDREGWYAFLGCWAPDSGMGPTMCVRPTTDGVEIARVAEGRVVSRDAWSTRPEGVRSEQEGCEGVHHATFSEDRKRVFLSSSYTCEGGNERHETGVLTLPRADELLDVRSVDVEVDEPVAWVQRYVATDPAVGQQAGVADLPAEGMALETARRTASTRLDVADVVEAVDHLGPGALEAWVAETGDGFDVDADLLVELADNGVPRAVLDLMIAVSYPGRFALAVDDRGVSAEHIAAAASGRTRGVYGGVARCSGYGYGYGYGYGFGSPLFYDRYDPACGYGYRYSRYSYGPYGYGGGWYGYYNPRVIVVPGDSGGGTNGNARAVRGRGYTRGASDGPATGSASSGGTPSSSGGAATSGGGSRGSSPPVRRAKPRGGGGGV